MERAISAKSTRGEEAKVSAPKRKRLSLACEACRKKKTKCDGARPQCGNCVNANMKCVYNPSKKKRGPNKDYVDQLEKRLVRMEKLLQSFQEGQPSGENPQVDFQQKLLKQQWEAGAMREATKSHSQSPCCSPVTIELADTNSQHCMPFSVDSNPRELGSEDVRLGIDAQKMKSSMPMEKHQSEQESWRRRVEGGLRLYFDSASDIPDADRLSKSLLDLFSAKPLLFEILSKKEADQSPSHLSVNLSLPESIPRSPSNKGQLPADLLADLVMGFFQHMWTTLPVIHKPTFMKQLQNNQVPPMLLYSVLAVSSRFSKRRELQHDPPCLAGELFTNRALDLISQSWDQPSVATVQAMLILGVHEIGCARGSRAGMLLGMATRMAQELGMHHEIPDGLVMVPTESGFIPRKLDWSEQETRRRCFWVCFLIDRLCSAAIGRTQTIHELDCEVFLPTEDEDYELERMVVTERLNEGEEWATTAREDDVTRSKRWGTVTLSRLGYLVRIVALLGRVVRFNSRDIPITTSTYLNELMKLNASILSWKLSLPDHLRLKEQNLKAELAQSNRCFLLMHIIYNTAIIMLHRNYLFAKPEEKQVLDSLSETSAKYCICSANILVDLLWNLEMKQLYGIAYYAPGCVYIACSIHLRYLNAPDRALAAKCRESVERGVVLLERMQTFWGMAGNALALLRDSYGLHRTLEVSHGKSEERWATSEAPSQQVENGSSSVARMTLFPMSDERSPCPVYCSGLRKSNSVATTASNPGPTPSTVPMKSREFGGAIDTLHEEHGNPMENTLANLFTTTTTIESMPSSTAPEQMHDIQPAPPHIADVYLRCGSPGG
ncbi:uncharacterized protein VTP21DRAFT_1206 [Calcarisporiella thermophila]|uniref:uncharacterized protein n=1 Tax=Calcarisporiella thermophila TaxID=911321 RepID=UPI0037424424